MQPKIGLIARTDNSGLGRQCKDFYDNLPIEKVLTIPSSYQCDFNYYKNQIIANEIPTSEEIDEFLKGINVVLTFETPYNWNLIERAKRKNIKTIIFPNYEWTIENPPIHPDLYICLSELHYNLSSEPKFYLPMPIDRKKFPFKLRKKAKDFLYNHGHGGIGGRNCFEELLGAIPEIKKRDIKFIINSQVDIRVHPAHSSILEDKRLDIRKEDLSIEDLYKRGDIFLYPLRWTGLSLSIREAMSSGLPVMTTNLYPFNQFLPNELLIPIEGTRKERLCQDCRVIDAAIISPTEITKKVNEFAGNNIEKYSKISDEIAEKWSWKNLKSKYIKVFKEL